MSETFRTVWFAVCAAFALATGSLLPAPAFAQANVNSESKYSAVVIDANSGEVLYAKRADSPRYPASITKIMTLYLVFEAMAQGRISPDEQVPVSKHAASQQPTKLGLDAGETIAVNDAIQAIAVQSANDMAVAMAERIGGTESRFAAMMTLRAQQLGMTQSRFVNASGLPDSRQISSARDIAILSRAIMRDFPQYYTYLGQHQFAYQGRVMNNHNALLLKMQGVDGLKTGFTSASGYNLAASAVRGNRRLIAVVLGGNSHVARDDQVQNLLETGFEVVRRRQNGENITIAQNLFEPPPSTSDYARAEGSDLGEDAAEDGGYMRVSSGGQTLGDDDADAPIPAVVRPAQPVAPKPVAIAALRPSQKAAPVIKKPAGRYMVQVGAFKDRALARTQLNDMNRRFTKYFDDAEADIGDKVGGFFRARFTGLTSDAARSACSALKAKHIPCMVIEP